MSPPADIEAALAGKPRRWLVTGAAGFIGSHLVERLLALGHNVVGVDDLSTGHRKNLEQAVAGGGLNAKVRFRFIEGDLSDHAVARAACAESEFVLHQAAVGSVPRSIQDPLRTHRANVDGFASLIEAARLAKVERLVFASSSSVYGDDPRLPKRVGEEGRLLSPYAASKKANEILAQAYAQAYGFPVVGLRYFNVFGPRQDPNGAYAAVIPRWIAALSRGEVCEIFGDGETARDFCYVANVVQANLKAALAAPEAVRGQVFNVAAGGRTTLKVLYASLRDQVATNSPAAAKLEPVFKPFRAGDIRDSHADLSQTAAAIGYAPTHTLREGLVPTVASFLGAKA
ncbi:MAG: NAD-dependent epimerase/dehydratase family protein [Myxococcaceae bacterium]|nr:NAD-dependent epimerase/dehydratase family protein [Myxococcaceae bacterium]